MSASSTTSQPLNHPPPAPPLPPSRLGPLQRFIAPLSGLAKPARSATDHLSDRPPPPTRPLTRPSNGSHNAKTTVQHRTGISIAAIDINRDATHAVLAGREILKTVRVGDEKATEDINLRTSIQSYASYSTNRDSARGDTAKRRKDYLPARDVKWSKGAHSSHIVATAAATGRLALYDINASGPRIELAWLKDHTSQVNKIDIDPAGGWLLLSASQDGTVKLWDIRDPRPEKAKSRFDVRSSVRHVCWSPKEGNDFDFAVSADGGLVQNWDVRSTLAPKVSIHAHDKGCYSLDWHPDGRHVVSGGFDKYVKTWDFKNNNRRQKPAFQFRVSQAVRSVSWRPASELYYRGTWQSTHIATTYHYDDARVHVWDLTRPHLPWLELCNTARPPTDLLWASADHIWTAGEEGIFSQSDVSTVPKVRDTISPSALEWLPGGDSAMFMEERFANNLNLNSEIFADLSKEKLDGFTDKQKSNDDDDENESSHRMSFASSLRSRQNRELSYRSDTSRASTPPERRHIQQLDKTVHGGRILQQNDQFGAIGRVPSAPENKDLAAFLASNYAPIATDEERRAAPERILTRLKEAFLNNAEVSDEAALYRQAQSWRILAAVLIPELETWAKKNQEARRHEAERRQSHRKTHRSSASEHPPAFAKVYGKDRNLRVEPKESNMISNLFKSLKEPGRLDTDSTSNMTTPLARPLPDSPRRTPRHHQSKGSNSSLSTIDDLPALPPSLLNSHVTAAAAARALHNDDREESVSPMSSPESSRTKRNKSTSLGEGLLSPRHPLDPIERLPRASPYMQAQKQEQKRNALRDYRAQARPIFSLESQAAEVDYTKNSQHDSAESFPMFSASTGSSQKARSMGQSAESKAATHQLAQRHDSWLSREDSSESTSTTDKSSAPVGPSMRDFSMGSDAPQFSMDATPELKPESEEFGPTDTGNDRGESVSYSEVAAVSCSPDILHFGLFQSPKKPRIHTFNPALQPATTHTPNGERHIKDLSDEEATSPSLIFHDFRPIDIATYNPPSPFACSAFPLLCQMIAYDVDAGVACGQFATHLILHTSPYFFGPSSVPLHSGTLPETLAERLMLPKYAPRSIEAILRKHLSFLTQTHLYVPHAVLRKSCVESGYDKNLFTNTPKPAERTISTKDANTLTIACSTCGIHLSPGRETCDACATMLARCPICDVKQSPANASVAWLACHSCGHSAHATCMQRWLACTRPRPASLGGICPTPACRCDCAPGTVRKKRIERQRRAFEEQALIQGGSSVKRDSKGVIGTSAAVERARGMVLREGSRDRERAADERNKGRRASAKAGSAGSSAASTGAFVGGSSRKSVRLITPGEEGS